MNYLAIRTEGDVLVMVFQVAAVVDSLSVDSVGTEWMRELESSDHKKLVIDFSSLEFLSSGLLGELLQLRAYCRSKGVSLKLCCLSKELKNVLSLTQLSTQFKTYHSQRGAIECFAADNFVVRHEFFARYGRDLDDETCFPQMVSTPTLDLIEKSPNEAMFGF